MRKSNRSKYFCLTVMMMCAAPAGNAVAQVIPELQFLLNALTPEGNGMGGLSSTLETDNALGTSYNPGHLGLFAFGHSMNIGVFTSKPTLYVSGYLRNPDY